MQKGTRVVRGPDWSSVRGPDGGEGHLGTVTSVQGETTYDVLWDNGKRSICRMGVKGKQDIIVMDSGPAGIRHEGHICAGCAKTIGGCRWTCSACQTCSLCSRCYGDMEHDITHTFLRFDHPSSKGLEVPARCSSVRIQSLGLVPNAVVEKSTDSQEPPDGPKNQKGNILAIKDHSSGASARSMVRVQWEDGETGLYRAGHEGLVDVHYVTEYPGMFYYRDHIAAFTSTAQTNKSPTSTPSSNLKPRLFKQGDRVCIGISVPKLKEMQIQEDIWNQKILEVLPKLGTVKTYTNGGHVAVAFGGEVVVLCEKALKKVPLLTEGDKVRITSNLEELKQLQDQHGGFVENMKMAMNKVGLVTKIEVNGDAEVRFGNTKWQFNPACCTPVSDCPVDRLEDKRVSHLHELFQHAQLFQHVQLFQRMFEEITNLGGDAEERSHMTKLDGEEVTDTQLVEKVDTMYQAFARGDHSLCLSLMRGDNRMKRILHKGCNLLILAIDNNRLEFAHQLLDEGVDVNFKDESGNTAILHAVISKNCDMVKLLLNQGCDISIPGHMQATPFEMCVKMGSTDIAKMLLEKDVDVNKMDLMGESPVHLAVYTGHNDILSLIFKSKAKVDPTLVNEKGFTILHTAAISGNYRAAEIIIEMFPQTVELKMGFHLFTALHIAANNDHTDCIRVLLEKGNADIHARNSEGWTALHLACLKLHDSSVNYLLQKGAVVNEKDNKGQTALHFVMGGGVLANNASVLGLERRQAGEDEKRIQLSCKLIQSGADPNMKNSKGATPLDCAVNNTIKNAVIMYFRSRTNSSSSTPSAASTMSLPCSKCLVVLADVKLKPCGHRFLCRNCVASTKHCPFCKAEIHGTEELSNMGAAAPEQNCKVQ